MRECLGEGGRGSSHLQTGIKAPGKSIWTQDLGAASPALFFLSNARTDVFSGTLLEKGVWYKLVLAKKMQMTTQISQAFFHDVWPLGELSGSLLSVGSSAVNWLPPGDSWGWENPRGGRVGQGPGYDAGPDPSRSGCSEVSGWCAQSCGLRPTLPTLQRNPSAGVRTLL